MRRTLIVLFLAFLISSSFTQIATSQPEKSVPQQKSSAPLKQATKSKLLFYQLPILEGPQELVFWVKVDGLPHVAEQISLSPDQARQSPTIELLSRKPEQLKELYRLAKNGAHQVEVIVMLNNQIAREFSFRELLSYNRDLKQQISFRPASVESKVVKIGLAQNKLKRSKGNLVTAGECELQCHNQYSLCAEALCGSPTALCGPCLTDLDTCLSGCPPPPIPEHCPTTSCSASDQLIGATWYGTQCLTNFFQEKKLFDQYLLQYKRTTTCVTTDPCAGTTSTNVSVTYYNRWCEQETFWSCSLSFGFSFGCF